MIPRISAFCAAALLLSTTGAPVFAQAQNRYRLESLNFYLWCQDTARLPAAQCDRRLPEDVTRFETYRATIERYEIPYLQEKEKRINLNRAILHNDPVGNPISKSPQDQAQGQGQAQTPRPQTGP